MAAILTSDLDVHERAHHEDVRDEEAADDERGRDEVRRFPSRRHSSRAGDVDPDSASSGKPDRKLPDHFASAVIARTRRNSLKRARITLARPSRISARLPPEVLLDRHGDGEEAQVLHVQRSAMALSASPTSRP
jgi:hypothetical protein